MIKAILKADRLSEDDNSVFVVNESADGTQAPRITGETYGRLRDHNTHIFCEIIDRLSLLGNRGDTNASGRLRELIKILETCDSIFAGFDVLMLSKRYYNHKTYKVYGGRNSCIPVGRGKQVYREMRECGVRRDGIIAHLKYKHHINVIVEQPDAEPETQATIQLFKSLTQLVEEHQIDIVLIRDRGQGSGKIMVDLDYGKGTVKCL